VSRTYVFTADGSPALEWMSRLLAWSYHRHGHTDRLVRVWTSDAEPTPFAGDTFQTRNYASYDGGYYPPYNRVCGLRDWLAADPVPDDETVVVLEHDMLFLDRWEPIARSGVMQGNGPWYYLAAHPQGDPRWFKRHCKQRDMVGGAGIPLVVTAGNLRAIHDGLPKRVKRIRRDDHADRGVWIDEMYAVVFAAADLGMTTEATWLTEHPPYAYPRGPLPMLHYAWLCEHPSGWRWWKHEYQPWTDPGVPPDDMEPATHRLVGALREYVNARKAPAEKRGLSCTRGADVRSS
jgi:hypothetical protein